MRAVPLEPGRFFCVMPLHSPSVFFGFGAAVVAGALALVLEPGAGVSALVPVLMLQMFAAASGFDVPARRGHFDLLLTGGASRTRVALGHFVMSVLPGATAWCALGLLELAVSRGAHASAFSSGSLAAMFVVSVIAWAVTVPLPRLSGGVIWLFLVALAFAPPTSSQPTFTAARGGEGTSLTRAVVSILFPFRLVGRELDGALPVLVGALVWIAALWWVVHQDVPLESAQ